MVAQALGLDPFSGAEVGGVIQGLGTTDMKGGLMAALAAIDLVKSAGLRLKGDVFFQSVIDEEGAATEHWPLWCRVSRLMPPWCVSPPSASAGGPYGVHLLQVLPVGQSHSFWPQVGRENAIAYAMKLIARLMSWSISG